MAFLDETGLGTFLAYVKAWARSVFVGVSGDQTISGTKTFSNAIAGNVTGSANSATYSTTQSASDNSTKIATTAFVKSQGYITSAGSITGSSGSCTGNAATATAFSASTPVALAGAVTGSASSTGGWSIPTLWRCCSVGQSSSTNTNPWYKVATVLCDSAYTDYSITFFIEERYGVDCRQGILKAHIRTKDGPVIDTGLNQTSLVFLSHTGYTLSDFVLVCPTTPSSTAELWTRIPVPYLFRIFTVISEGYRQWNAIGWTLLNASSAGQNASITTAGTQITAVYGGDVDNLAARVRALEERLNG